ncbi:MAG: YdcF family protein [Alphaproteobacteria bacterium]
MQDLAKEFNNIGRYLLIEQTALTRADAALIFGNRSVATSLADAAANYYNQGYFSKIVVSGGHIVDPDLACPSTVKTEAEYIAEQLTARGVKADAIICEKDATNTQENVEFCREIFKNHAALQNATSVMSFGNIIASRRFLMTLNAHWPEMLAMHVGVNGYDFPVSQWYKDESFRSAVIDQYKRIEPYKSNGWIKEIDLDAINARIHKLR